MIQILTLTSADVGDTITTSPIIVKSIRVHGLALSVAGDEFRIVKPGGGDELLFRTYAAGAWYVEESITQRLWITGFKLLTLTHGEIDIEYDNGNEARF
jgi:hypothetical protein